MALNRSIVLGSRKIYIYLTNLKGRFGKIYRIYRGTTLGPKIVLAEPKTRFYNYVVIVVVVVVVALLVVAHHTIFSCHQ